MLSLSRREFAVRPFLLVLFSLMFAQPGFQPGPIL